MCVVQTRLAYQFPPPPLPLFLLSSGFVESVRGVNPSRTHGAQGDQLVFQRVVVQQWLEFAARGWRCHGVRRIILVFGTPGACVPRP